MALADSGHECLREGMEKALRERAGGELGAKRLKKDGEKKFVLIILK